MASGTRSSRASRARRRRRSRPPYTTLATTPVSREKPFLYVDSNGSFNVWVPDVQTDSSGVTWANGQTPGHAKPISDFFIAKPSDSVATLNNALAHKKSLILTPGIYNFSQTMVITPDTIVLGMGLATIVPQNGIVPVKVQNVKGVEISDVVFDAGPVNSPALLQIGNPAASRQSDPADPSVLSDVYFRIGGAHLGKATTSLVVNSDDVILDNIWAWRADHGTGVGWTSNTADTGVVVNGDDVTATGLFVEHYQKNEVVWNGQNGRVVFFQNEMPYDPPSQAAWTQPDGTLGYPAIEVGNGVKTFNAWGIGLQLLQPGRGHPLRERVRGSHDACARKRERRLHDLPLDRRLRRDRPRDQRDGRVIDHRQSRCRGSRPELPVTSDLLPAEQAIPR